MAGSFGAPSGLMEPLPFPKGEPPGLSEPLVRVKAAGVQNIMAWVQNTVTQLSAGLEAQRDLHGSLEEEMRSETRSLRERLGAVEGRMGLVSPVRTHPGTPVAGLDRQSSAVSTKGLATLDEGEASTPSAQLGQSPDLTSPGLQALLEDLANRMMALEVGAPQPSVSSSVTGGSQPMGSPMSVGFGQQGIAERVRQVEESLSQFREHQSRSASTQNDLVGMRLETIEQELTTCVQLKDLEKQRADLDVERKRNEQELQEAVRNLGLDLRGELAAKADELRASLQTASKLIGGSGATGQSGGAAAAIGVGGQSADNREIWELDGRVSQMEEMFSNMYDDVKKLKDAASDSLISGALEGAPDDKVQLVMQAVKDASKNGDDALKKVVSLDGNVRQLSNQVDAIAGGTGGAPAGIVGAAGAGLALGGEQMPAGSSARIQQVEEKVNSVLGDVRALKDAEREKMIGSALEGASDDQIGQVLAAVKDASKEGAEALTKVEALTNEVHAYNVPGLTAALQASQTAIASLTGSPVPVMQPPPPLGGGGQVVSRDLDFAALAANPSGGGQVVSRDLDFAALAANPSGSPTMAQPSPVAQAMQGQLQQLADISEIQSRLQDLAEQVRDLRDSGKKSATPAGSSGPPGSSGGKKSRRQSSDGASPVSALPGTAQQPGEAAPVPGDAAASTGEATAAGMESDESSPDGMLQGIASGDIGGLEVWDEDDDLSDDRAAAMERKLAQLQTKLEAVRESAMKEAAALVSSLPDEARIVNLETRVGELSGRPMSSTSAGVAAPSAASGAMAAARAAALAAGGDGEGGAVEAALAAVDAVAQAMGGRIDGLSKEVQALNKRGGGAAGGGGAGGAQVAGGKKQKQKGKGDDAGNVPGAPAQAKSAGNASAVPATAAGSGAGAEAATTMDAVAAVAARADELAQQFEDDDYAEGDSDDGDGMPVSLRLAKLESQVSIMSRSLEGLVHSQREGLFASEAGAASAGDAGVDSTGGSEGVQHAGAPAHTGGPAELEASSSVGPSPGASPSASPMDSKRAVTPQAVNALGSKVGKVELLCKNLSVVVQRLVDKPELSESAIAELDGRIETRLTAVWNELTQHAKAAALRADALEKQLVARLNSHDDSIKHLTAEVAKNKDLADQVTALAKQIEWLNWRISWLEWATGGEKRGFSRPIDSKAVLPPPQTVTATAFGQPLSDDVELWARGPDGRQRLRRPIRAPLAAVHDARSEMGNFAGDSLQSSALRASQSTGKLPQLR